MSHCAVVVATPKALEISNRATLMMFSLNAEANATTYSTTSMAMLPEPAAGAAVACAVEAGALTAMVPADLLVSCMKNPFERQTAARRDK